ncbi:hypothetical protein B9T27_06705 [Acinetobacter sp. ANC 4648]|nr:hypothetical protein B9T27_06705 [Acinetobacter sp. ANC 4648]
MSKSQQNVWEAARLLGISPATLDYRQKSAERIKQKADQKNILFSLQGFN